ncbi:MAG: TIGR01212 family radical SAM protein [Ruminococcaceae bacterium]|nr:TIGR01212 family radical SAM protein [Oscillospiraceae bacterium]
MYKSFHEYCREVFGCKVYKLSIDGGFTCPNRDGTVGVGGCIFCSAYGGGEFAEGLCQSVAIQLEQAKKRVAAKNKNGKYMAYFQSFTGTYAPLDHLKQLYLQAIAPDDIVGLSIGTRPDCLQPQIIDLLAKINRQKPVFVELGLQTVHPETVRYIRRGYDNGVYFDAVRRLKEAGIQVVTHIILGLPGETEQMAVETTQQAVAAGTDGVKFHLLHVLRNTDLEQDYLAGKFSCLSMEEYARWLKKCLSILPPHIVVHRITGDGAKRDLIAPLWSADKKRVLNYLNAYLQE